MRKPGSRLCLAALLLVSVWPTVAAAQDAAVNGFEVFGAVGPGQMWDDEGYLGIAPVWRGGVGYRWGSIGLEFGLDHRRHQPDFNDPVNEVVFKANGTRAMARALYYFRRGSVQPFAGGGIGFANVWRFSEFPTDCHFVDHQFICDGVERFESTDQSRAWGAIAGVRFAFAARWYLRPEFEMGHSKDSLTMTSMIVIGRYW